MPRFFKRLFKFPQMDFEMAIWEMWSLLIAPKKVFRSVYYHKRMLVPPPTQNKNLLGVKDWQLADILEIRDKEHMAPARPVVHVPSFVLYGAYGTGVGDHEHALCDGDTAADADIRVRAFPGGVAACGDDGVFLRREVAGTRDRGIAGEEEADGTVR